MGSNTVAVTDQSFSDSVSSSTPTLVDFWAEWCGPCRMVAPVLEELASEHSGKLTVAKLNVDENPYTARQFDVMSIPTLILFQDGVEKKRLVGARSKQNLLQELGEFLG